MENLFRPGGDFGPHDDDAYQVKIHGLADTISQADVDFLAVEEVGDSAAPMTSQPCWTATGKP